MWHIIKEYRHYLATLALVTVPVIALNAGGKSPANLYWFDRAAIAVTSPLQFAIRWTLDTSWDGVQSYIFLFHAKKQNEDLSFENRKLLNELAAFQEVALENERLRKIVKFNETVQGPKIVARVIAQDVSPEFRVVRVNKGKKDGAENGMAVVALEGVVGRVFRIGRDFSDVLTMLDSSSAIDSLIQRNRVRGIVEGTGSQTLNLKYLRRTDDVQEGDILVSSGIGGLFPRGLAVGKVISVKKKNFGITQQVEVMPAVDFNRLEEVTLVDPPEMPLTLPPESIPPVNEKNPPATGPLPAPVQKVP